MAIAGSFLIGLGFPPFQAATVCLLANTAPVAWGGVGNPIRVLAGVTGLPEHALNAMTGRILPPFSFILPIWLVRSMAGWRRPLRCCRPCWWPGLFAFMQFSWSNFVETDLVDIMAAVFSLLVMVAFLSVAAAHAHEVNDGGTIAARAVTRWEPCSRAGRPLPWPPS